MKIVIENLPEFRRALLEYQQATLKDGAEILNRAGRNVAFRAASFTPISTAAKIRADLNKDPHLKYALTSLFLRKKGRGILKSPQFREAVRKFIARRVASRGYLRSGWAPAIEALGGSYRGRKVGKGHGWARKASMTHLVTEISNTVPGIDEMGVEALNEAIDFVAADMLEYAQGLLAKRAKEHSP
jgi:hypothetical protein